MIGSDPLTPGELLDGRYRIGPRIGEGAFAVVHEAERRHDQRCVAVKALASDAEEMDPAAVKRFRREMKLAAELQHPNIVEVLDWGMTGDGRLYLVMERLHGHPLIDVMYEEPFPEAAVRHVLIHVLAALDYAHERGFVHRDIKPSNVFLVTPQGTTAERVRDTLSGQTDLSPRDTVRTGWPAILRERFAERPSDGGFNRADTPVPWPTALEADDRPENVGVYGVALDSAPPEPRDPAQRAGLLGAEDPAFRWAPDERYQVKVLDFGLSRGIRGKRITFNSPLTSDGQMVGTPGYFAPELLGEPGKKLPVTPQADLYAVGLLGYEMLMAEPAFHGVGVAAMFQQLTQHPKPPPTWIRRLQIYSVIEHLMERDPSDRYASARAAIHDLPRLP